jgi:exodeoxyribonuclease V alpha subunit
MRGRPPWCSIARKNDYTQDLWNGDIGVCVETADGLWVLFDRAGGRELLPSHLGEHTTVHAMTIHESQGSQFDEVAVVLPNELSRLLTRELLYTAVTRARTRSTSSAARKWSGSQSSARCNWCPALGCG